MIRYYHMYDICCYVGLTLCMMFTKLLCMISMRWIVLFCPPSFGLVNCGIAPVHFLVPLWIVVPIERHWLGMHIMIWSLNGALPFYNTIIACVLHELSKAQLFMLLTYWALCISIVLHVAYIVGLHHVYPYAAKMSKIHINKKQNRILIPKLYSFTRHIGRLPEKLFCKQV